MAMDPMGIRLAAVLADTSAYADARESYVVPKYNEVDGDYKIMPSDIPDFEHLCNAFNNTGTEISAGYIVRFCKERGHWKPFDFDEINAFYNRKPKGHRFGFNRLIEPGMAYGGPGQCWLTGGGWIIKRGGMYYITDDFIERVRRSTVGRHAKKT